MRPALEGESGHVTYGSLEQLVLEVASRLRSSGVRQGDRVLLFLPNSAEYVISLLAVTAAGAVAVPVPMTVGPDRLRYVIDITRPRLCLHDSSDPIDGVKCHRIAIDIPAARLGPQLMAGDLLDPPDAGLPDVDPDAVAVILFSSGSTGRPKGVVLTHQHLVATARTLSSVFRLDAAHRDLIIAPMCHSDGWQRVAATLFAGGCVVSSQRSLSPADVLELLSSRDISGCFLPTPVLRLLLRGSPELIQSVLHTMRSLELGSTPITAQELTRVADQAPDSRLFFHYGLTECSRAVILDVREHPGKLATVGRAAPGVEIRICDSHHHPVGVGETGEIMLRGPQQSEGYWGRRDLNEEKFFDGWLLTGDFGSLDADGFLTLLGRRDDMVTSAGYHFFPAEVETELGPVPGVIDYLVAGVSSQSGLLDQLLWAFVVPADPGHWVPQTLLALARRRLPSHMRPRRVVTVPALPLTPSGKPDRAMAVHLYAAPAETRSSSPETVWT
jgi:acyl-CoA synthetase (AMP-forming)/AMP-acid ligase II